MNMKHATQRTLLAALLAAPFGTLLAAEKTDAPPKKTERREIRVIRSHDDKQAPKMKVAFLGVLTAPVPPALAAQLGLPSDSGLVVSQVVPDSPAGGVLKQHDILLKIDDQILIDTRQLAVLVRRHKEGDEVTLTFIRAAKEQTARVTLKVQEMPPLPPADDLHGAIGPMRRIEIHRDGAEGGRSLGSFGMAQPLPRDEAGRMLGMLHRAPHEPLGMIESGPGTPMRRVFVHPGRSKMVFKDDAGTLELGIEDGTKQLVAKDGDGKELFSGPVSTPEQRKALPASVRERLDKLEKMEGVNFDRLERLNTGGPNWENRMDHLFQIPLPPAGRRGVNPPAI